MCAIRSVYTSQADPANRTPTLLVNFMLVMPEKGLPLIIDLVELVDFWCC
jgi:hypothetical protein